LKDTPQGDLKGPPQGDLKTRHSRGTSMSRKLVLVLGAAILIAAAVGARLLWGPSGGAVRAAGAATPARPGFEIHPQDRTMGNPKAKVVLIEYAALSCPHCAAFEQQVFPRIKQNYIDTGKVLYVFRLYPLMPEDGAAARVAGCAPKDRYFQVIHLLFQNQPQWDPEFGVLDVRGGLTGIGVMAGLSKDAIDKCLADTGDDARINAAAAEARTRYGVTGTPSFVVNGVAQPSGGLDYPALARLLDRAGAAP
jgi:protein-disulfide isomerase